MSSNSLDSAGEEFYSNAVNYWSEIPATIDGMLGGFGYISQTDIKGSKMLLKQLFNSKDPPGKEYVLDCGAGIGRISKFLLTEIFDKVDMVEQNGAFLDQAKKYLGPKIKNVHSFFSIGLQNFEPEPRKYDVIWVQWVIGHLTNKDLIQFLISCCKGLKKNGVIVLKENVTSTDEIEKDEQDSSVTRPMYLFHQLFQKANLTCYRQTKQQNFPKGLFSVYMFVLKPIDSYLDGNLIENDILENNTVIENDTIIGCDSVNESNSVIENNIKNNSVIETCNILENSAIETSTNLESDIKHDCDKIVEKGQAVLSDSQDFQ